MLASTLSLSLTHTCHTHTHTHSMVLEREAVERPQAHAPMRGRVGEGWGGRGGELFWCVHDYVIVCVCVCGEGVSQSGGGLSCEGVGG